MTEKEEIEALKEKIADLERRLSVVESDTGYISKQVEDQTQYCPGNLCDWRISYD